MKYHQHNINKINKLKRRAIMIEIEKWSISLHLENKYSLNSCDNIWNYKKYYYGIECDEHNAIEFIGVRCNITGLDVLLVSAGSMKGLHEGSYLVDEERLLICVGNSLFCLNIIDFSLIWTIVCDMSCCFQVFKLEDNYLVHGELAITAISYSGKKVWEFYGRDMFVTPNGENEFQIIKGNVVLRDWGENKYILDKNGKEVFE